MKYINLSQGKVAKIFVNGRYIHIGFYANKDDAAQAYNNALKQYFNEYAIGG